MESFKLKFFNSIMHNNNENKKNQNKNSWLFLHEFK